MTKEFYFSLDFNGEIEDMDIYENVEENEVEGIINTLKEKGLMVSEHRTQGEVIIKDGTVNVDYQYFTGPEDGLYDELTLTTTI